MLDRIDRSNAALVEWAADFYRRYPVRWRPHRKSVDTVTWWLLVGVNDLLEIEDEQEANKEEETQNHGASLR